MAEPLSAPSIVFGPVPSRRLGRSLGVNNVPPKTCTYSCIYCQLGATTRLSIERRAFYDPNMVIGAVLSRLKNIDVDYITFAPDGEPTLDVNIGREIEGIKKLGARVAVLTNASLLWRDDVRSDLSEADLVSIKVDAVSPRVWRMMNRPHSCLDINEVLDGVRRFSRGFRGVLISETMIVEGVCSIEEVERIASFLSTLNISRAYLAIPTRPPAEEWVRPPSEQEVLQAYNIFARVLGRERVRLLLGFAKGDFGGSGDLRNELLSILSVHPMRRIEVERFLMRRGASMDVVEELVRSGRIVRVGYMGEEFYVLRLPGRGIHSSSNQ